MCGHLPANSNTRLRLPHHHLMLISPQPRTTAPTSSATNDDTGITINAVVFPNITSPPPLMLHDTTTWRIRINSMVGA